MRIQLHRLDDPYHFQATNESGNVLSVDASPAIGGAGKGPRPMELLLMGVGGCTGIDIVNILKKQRQEILDFDMEIEATRAESAPKVFTGIHIRYILKGDLDPDKVRRAIVLSKEKYCSASIMLGKTATITFSYVVNGMEYEG